jgi:hypothetical protein
MTARRTAQAWLWAASLLLAACAPYQTAEKVTPVSYRQADDLLQRNLGLLRRVAVIELSQSPPAACGAAYDGRAAWSDIHPSMNRVLGDEKGYELVFIDPTQRTAAMLDEIGAWPSWDKPAKAGPAIGALMDDLRTQRRVDALLVRLDRSTCQMGEPMWRAAMGAMTLGFNELLPDPRMLKIYSVTQAWIFETATGKLVWQHSVDQGNEELKDFVFLRKKSPLITEELLGTLEPAIPRILTR